MINPEIIKIASDTSNCGIKNNSNLLATSRNKICGDEITIEIEICNEKIQKMSYETESCIFCQASASLLSNIIKKSNIKSLRIDIEEISSSHKNKKIILKALNNPFVSMCVKHYFTSTLKGNKARKSKERRRNIKMFVFCCGLKSTQYTMARLFAD